MTFRVRDAKADDMRFVFDTWTRSFRQHVSPEELRCGYATAQRELISHCIETGRCVVACSTEDSDERKAEDVLYGHACGQVGGDVGLVLHFVYVKDVWRRRGIGRALVEELRRTGKNRSVVVTHLPRAQTHRTLVDKVKAMGWGIAPLAPAYRYISKGLEDG